MTQIVPRVKALASAFCGLRQLVEVRATRATPKLQKKTIRSWLEMDTRTQKQFVTECNEFL